MLLRHNADVNATDEYGKTPRQTAELSSKKNVVHILRGAGKVRSSTRLAHLNQLHITVNVETACIPVVE